MGKIIQLDELTINQIAAGEVIERPASVVKEMVENSIDAGANQITVEVKNGGISYIRITDNGKGIGQDDLEIAFERHATSKIRSAEDLNTVTSNGFRGEALASIAAIANVEVISKTPTQDVGYKLVIEAGKVLKKEEVACPTGTTFTVSNLFFNTPVRYKFLKKDYTELGYIEDVVTRIALVRPEISIKLINAGKTIIQTNGNGNIQDVIYSIYGKDVANGIIPTTYEYEDMKITGVVGKPVIARSNRSHQMYFVNRRFVKDNTLAAATAQGYKGMIPLGKFGFVVLNIEMNPAKVDVNVHPAKLEVRFEEEDKVFKAVYHTIKDSLLKVDLTENQLEKNVADETLFSNREEGTIKEYTNKEQETKTNVNANEPAKVVTPTIDTNDVLEKLKKLRETYGVAPIPAAKEKPEVDAENFANDELNEEELKNQAFGPIKEKVEELDSNTQAVSGDFDEMYTRLFGKKAAKIKEEKKEEEPKGPLKAVENVVDLIKDNVTIFEDEEEYEIPAYKFIGIVFNTYIILEMNNEMYILDQHAAHERIVYEKVKENYYASGTKESQMLLLPDVIELTHKEMNIATENMDMFEQAGFTLEEFGDTTMKLTGVPSICFDLDTKELFLETLDEINTVAITAKQEKEEKFISTIACKAAVKANMVLEEEEVKGLMEQLLKLPNPFTCPHGRPTAIKMTKYDVEKKFARK